MKTMKNGNAPGIDSHQAELWKADTTTACMVLTRLFAKIWNHGVIPKDYGKGLIFNIPKKSNPMTTGRA